MENPYGNTINFARFIERFRPTCTAELKGSPKYPEVRGKVYFYQTTLGVLVTSEVNGLPREKGKCNDNIFALHIHEGNSCTGNKSDLFADAGAHYNPQNCLHPQHAGDLPPLFGNNGYAWSSVLTNRFNVNEIIGKTIIVHRNPDDFKTQPAGDAGEKIACGIIHR